MALLGLPNELTLLIAQFLEDDCDLNALLQTCRRYFLLLRKYLYQHDVKHFHATALEWAAKTGQEAAARQALEAGAPSNAVFNEEFVPMALACIYGHEDVVRLLLDYGVDPNPVSGWANFNEDHDYAETDAWGYPLLMAAHRGHESIVKLLLARGAAPDNPTEDGDTPLHRAVVNGHLSIVKMLVTAGADINFCKSYGSTPLGAAVLKGNIDVVRFLIEMGAQKERANSIWEIPLCLAAGEGHIEIIKMLLEHGANPRPPVDNLTVMPLAMAANKEHYDVAEVLRSATGIQDIIASGDPSDSNHKMLLMVGAACGWDDLVQQLLEQGCSPDVVSPRRETFCFIRDDNPDIRPTENGVIIDWLRRYPSALALAAYRGRLSTVKILLHHGVKIHGKSGREQKPSPLYLAILATHRNVVEALLSYGANPDWQDPNGHPVLFRAVRSPEVFELLLDRGADPQLQTPRGESIISRALKSGSIPTVEILRRRNLFVVPQITRTQSSEDLFQDAVKGGRAMAGWLLDQGYTVEPGTSQVEYAIHWALSHANAPLVELLFERGLAASPSPTPGMNPFGQVHSSVRDFEAVAATMDALLAHDVDIEVEESPLLGAIEFKFGENVFPPCAHTYFELLTDRGADPLRGDPDGEPLLSIVASNGWKREIRIMLEGLRSCQVPLDELQWMIEYAGEVAIEHGHSDIWPILRRAYWREKNHR